MNDIEQECIILNSVWQMIDDMVNWAMFVKHDRTEPTNMMFETSQHSRLFIILLGDFLSELRAFKKRPIPLGLKPPPSSAQPSDLTFLYYLRQICVNPKLGSQITDLQRCTESFAAWLEGEFVAPGVNLHAIDVVADLRVARYRYLKICGDIAKHNLARLATNVAHIRKLLEASGHPVSEQDAYLAVENFFEWFHGDIFIYHSSQIAEFLNNTRWAIFDYLQPEYARSWHVVEDANPSFPLYAYRFPAGCNEAIARAMYWDLMNRVRGKPWLHRFLVHESFKRRY
ncbi:MAG: hypothetical protein WBD95_16395 [Xanthobacteraceae bacterium]